MTTVVVMLVACSAIGGYLAGTVRQAAETRIWRNTFIQTAATATLALTAREKQVAYLERSRREVTESRDEIIVRLLAVGSDAPLRELEPILAEPFDGPLAIALGGHALFACSGGNEHASPRCAVAEHAEAAFWGLERLSVRQNLAVQYLELRYMEGGDTAAELARTSLVKALATKSQSP